MNSYLDGSESIYTPWTLLFLEKRMIRKSFTFDDINERQISCTFINETTSMVSSLRDLLYIYEHEKIIILIQMFIIP
jgi:hypothetical protein